MKFTKDYSNFTSWQPEPAFALLIPARLPDRHGSLILPESYTKKNNSGICIAVNDTFEEFLDNELFFPNHSEYQIIDSETNVLLYVVPVNQVIMWRKPPKNIAAVSREKARDNSDALTFETIEHSKKD